MRNIMISIIKKNSFIYYGLKKISYQFKLIKFKKLNLQGKKAYISKLYYKMHDKNINWENPLSYTEKMQLYKLEGKDIEIKSKLSDKIAVREWVEEKIGKKYLIPEIGIYDSFEEIIKNDLPNSFVIKCNHDSGSTTVVRDLNKVNWNDLKYKYKFHLSTDYSYFTMEPQYSLIKPKIIIEELLDFDLSNNKIEDYKFLCFDGVVHFCWIDIDRFNNHKRNIYNLNWELQSWNQQNYGNYDKKINEPKNFKKMIEIAEKLSAGFSHVRVDLYNLNGKIYFGEMTFTNGSGFEKIYPQIWDNNLGKLWNL
ncbi:ATP-grasp fold amidoligase family protein [Thomasclavelia ramosa]|uniref:ATP-grasp fold amidoligase family protein n=1 Tax=Thomasclavelia ramosa TaxID=1547 RepID=UPI0022E79148|nr:ATP-grasp fold amidoligase family protein [Thomasclavelia ramosa]